MSAITFKVLGRPQPAGSKKAFVNRKTGRAVIVDDAKGSRSWKQEVASEATRALIDAADGDLFANLLDGPLEVWIVFALARPAGHYGTGRNRALLRPSAPEWPAVRPDVDKLSRAVMDACTGALWRDDAQVVRKTVEKVYGSPEGCVVTVTPMGVGGVHQLGRRAA